MHVLMHVIEDLALKSRNPAKDATWMDEDLMRHTFRMKQKIPHRQSALNVLQRYRAVLKASLDRYLARH